MISRSNGYNFKKIFAALTVSAIFLTHSTLFAGQEKGESTPAGNTASLKPSEIILNLLNKTSDSVELRARRVKEAMAANNYKPGNSSKINSFLKNDAVKNNRTIESKTNASIKPVQIKPQNTADARADSKPAALAISTVAGTAPGVSSNSEPRPASALTLNNCVDIALKTNPQILESLLLINTYKFKIEQSKASLRPQTSAGVRGSWQGSDTSSRAGDSNSLNSSKSVNLNYSQILYDGGKIESGIKAAETNLEINELNHQKLVMDVILKICENYYSLITSLRLEKVAQQTYEGAIMHQDLAEANFNVGISPKTDFIRAQTNTFEKKYSLISANNALKKARLALNYTLGRAGYDVTVIDDLNCDTIGIDLENSINRAIAARTEIEAAKKGIDVYKLQIRQIKAEKAPQISIGANAGMDFDNNASKSSKSSYSVFTNFSLPLTNGYITENKINELEEKIKAEERKLEYLILTIKYDVNQAYLNLLEAYEQIGVAAKNVEYADTTLKLTDEQYKVGLATMIDLIDAEVAYNKAMTNHIQSQGNFLIARCKFRRNIGDTEFYK